MNTLTNTLAHETMRKPTVWTRPRLATVLLSGRRVTATVTVSATLTATAALASQIPRSSPTPAKTAAEIWLAASDDTLNQLRGGFDLGAGLVVSFGISRAVYVNDQLVTSTSFHLGDLRTMNPAQALAWGQQMAANRALIVQNGPGNTIAPDALSKTAWSTTLQNTLNNQSLRNQTVIEASTNALGLLKSLNLQASINEAIASALARR
ncbi:MAG: hypothetical protein RLZZ591_2753 [Pseudomonadota bacterium]|jgi:hypothetical protein